MSQSRSSAIAFAALASLVAIGCPIDERTLVGIKDQASGAGSDAGDGGGGTAGDDGDGGDGLGGNGDSGAGGTNPAGGAGGSPALGGGVNAPGGTTGQGGNDAPIGGTEGGSEGGAGGEDGNCKEDVNGNGVHDCTENLLPNGTFDTAIDTWQPELNSSALWNVTNAPGPGTGSIAVSNTINLDSPNFYITGSNYCLAVSTGTAYELTARGYIAASQSVATAGVSVFFFDTPGCAGALVGVGADKKSGAVDTWSTISATFVVPAGAQSMSVRLVVSKKFTDPNVTGLFDNVLLRTND